MTGTFISSLFDHGVDTHAASVIPKVDLLGQTTQLHFDTTNGHVVLGSLKQFEEIIEHFTHFCVTGDLTPFDWRHVGLVSPSTCQYRPWGDTIVEEVLSFNSQPVSQQVGNNQVVVCAFGVVNPTIFNDEGEELVDKLFVFDDVTTVTDCRHHNLAIEAITRMTTSTGGVEAEVALVRSIEADLPLRYRSLQTTILFFEIILLIDDAVVDPFEWIDTQGVEDNDQAVEDRQTSRLTFEHVSDVHVFHQHVCDEVRVLFDVGFVDSASHQDFCSLDVIQNHTHGVVIAT
ncbi:hypothetical protein D3C87_1410030 [compost metagenome]